MLELEISEEQLALLLQSSRQFAFEQLAQGEQLLPFATRVKADGEIEFARFAEDGGEQSLEAIYAATAQAMAKEAKAGEIAAAALVAAVEMQAPGSDHTQAIRIHLEAPGFTRQVLAPFAVVPSGANGSQASLELGELIPVEASAEIFVD